MARKVRGPAALKSAAATIVYEFQMLLVGHQVMRSGPTPEENNLALEAFLVHARNLLEFFATSGYPDSILAKDFVSQMPRIAMPYLRSNRKRLHRRLAHPSYSRPRLGRGWELDRLVWEVGTAMGAFLERLEEERPGRLAWFGDIPGLFARLGAVAPNFSGTITDSYPSPALPRQ